MRKGRGGSDDVGQHNDYDNPPRTGGYYTEASNLNLMPARHLLV